MLEIDNALNSQENLFAIYCAYKKIGTCVFHVESHQIVNRMQPTVFPNSWFSNEKSEHVSPFFQITGLETIGQENQGNGRLCLQALFECSRRSGCKGRMLVNAASGLAPFYECCGFEGGEVGQAGIKYFEPSQKSLSLLYKGSEEGGNFKLIPLSAQDPVIDKETFDRIIIKTQRQRV